MNKLSKFFLYVIVVLAIALGVITTLYLRERNVLMELKSSLNSGNVIENNKVNNEDILLEKWDISNVTMKLKEDTLTNTGATFIIEDNNDYHISWGTRYSIEKLENNEWKSGTEISQPTFIDTALIPDENGKLEIKIDWKTIYGKLSKGKYRVIKYPEIKNQKLYCEFEIK